MKAVVASVKREWWEKMLAGEKTMEIRKSAPQSKDGRTFTWPLTVLVYVSGTGTIPRQTFWKCWWTSLVFHWRICGHTQKAGAFTGG